MFNYISASDEEILKQDRIDDSEIIDAAEKINKKLSKVEIQLVKDQYPEERRNDLNAYTVLVLEQTIYSVIEH